MRLCIGSSKGIVILDPARGAVPLMVLADPAAIWCMAQDAIDPALLYSGAIEHVHGRDAVARSTDAGRSWTDITPPLAREEEIWAVSASPAVKDQLFIGTFAPRA